MVVPFSKSEVLFWEVTQSKKLVLTKINHKIKKRDKKFGMENLTHFNAVGAGCNFCIRKLALLFLYWSLLVA